MSSQGLQNFTKEDFRALGLASDFYGDMKILAAQEQQHVKTLRNAIMKLGDTPAPNCSYAFNIKNASDFIITASILEGIGVSAYIGAARYLSIAGYMTDLASILAVEAR